MDDLYRDLKIVSCPYMPPGFVCLVDRLGYVIVNLYTGYTIKIDNLESEFGRLPWIEV